MDHLVTHKPRPFNRRRHFSTIPFAAIRLMLEYFAEYDGLKHVLSALLNWVFLLIYARVD